MGELRIPSWCNGLPNSLKLYSEDVLEFYGLKSTRGNVRNIHREINIGRIPKPLEMIGYGGSKRKNFWLLGDMRKLHSELLK